MRGNEIKKTPLIHSPTFSKITGSEVYLKAEFRQRTGSFKIRGAYYKIKSLSDEEKKHGVVAASAGNHAQGMAKSQISCNHCNGGIIEYYDDGYMGKRGKCLSCKIDFPLE